MKNGVLEFLNLPLGELAVETLYQRGSHSIFNKFLHCIFIKLNRTLFDRGESSCVSLETN